MLTLGYPLLTAEDVLVLKALVRGHHQRLGRPLRGVEIGPWLGRSTLSMLAADLPLGVPLPFESQLYEFMTADPPPDVNTLIRQCEALVSTLPQAITRELIRDALLILWSWRIEHKHQYFEHLYCFDTWRGLASETLQYFRETRKGDPKTFFLANIERAGFGKVVSAVERTGTTLEGVPPGSVDFVFIDGDHECALVVADLYAVRSLVHPQTLLCGHDIHNVERWPGVKWAVEYCVRHYQTWANIWVATPEGLTHLTQMPEYRAIADEVDSVQQQHALRYQDLAYCARFGLTAGTMKLVGRREHE